MFPSKVGDDVIRSVITELTLDGKFPSGAQLRAVLDRRYRCRGGVARIYRLLKEQKDLSAASVADASRSIHLLEQEIVNLKDQLKRLRLREDAHQVYWEREIGSLRQRIEVLEPAVNAGIPERMEAVRQDVRAAEIRGGQLQVALRVFGPAAGRSGAETTSFRFAKRDE